MFELSYWFQTFLTIRDKLVQFRKHTNSTIVTRKPVHQFKSAVFWNNDSLNNKEQYFKQSIFIIKSYKCM